MLRYSLCALAGAYALQVFAVLPSAGNMVLAAIAGVLCTLVPIGRFFAAFIAGWVIMWLGASSNIADRLDPALQGETLTITARVLDFPSLKQGTLRFLVEPLAPSNLPSRVRLSWFDPELLGGVDETLMFPLVGQVWDFKVRLKRPRGFSNPGSFDYEGWLHRQRIGATGYVKSGQDVSGDYPQSDRQTRLRQHFSNRIDRLFPAGDSRAVLKAITVGARGEISDTQWQLYARTGTSHLMAISGLHIGLAAGGMFIIAWGFFGAMVSRHNVRDLALVAAILLAFAYAELSGFAVPAKRAFLMALLVAIAVFLRKQIAMQHVLGVVCLLVLVSDPLTIYAPGFMLSFLAVVVLLWSAQVFEPAVESLRRWHPRRIVALVKALSSLQLLLLFGLMPLTIALFGRVAILAPLTNMIVVPIFNLVTVPSCLLGLMLDGHAAVAGDPLLELSYASVDVVLRVIDFVGRWPVAAFEPAVSGLSVLLISGATAIWAILPPGWPGRYVALIGLLATMLHKPSPPAENCLFIHALDVGQGLAVVLRTRRHTLLFDTGPSFRSGSSTASLVIGPFLKSQGLQSLDKLVVSHADLDHSGGVEWLLGEFGDIQLLLGEPLGEKRPQGLPCKAGDAWQWDGVRFEFLHPDSARLWQGNDASCVLLVQAGAHKLLIPGDIEASAERALLARKALPQVDLVVVPHHGSRTSSASRFTDALRPSVAIVSAGYRNRWGFPKPEIVSRWELAGADVVATAQSGAVSRRYCAGKPAGPLLQQRLDAGRYWHDKEP